MLTPSVIDEPLFKVVLSSNPGFDEIFTRVIMYHERYSDLRGVFRQWDGEIKLNTTAYTPTVVQHFTPDNVL